jgi:hypothetical protein
MLKVRVDNYEEISIFLRDEKEQFFTAIIDSIKKGWKEKLTVVPVAEFVVKDTDIIIDIAIDEDDWNESLHLALYHYEDSEEYEMCTKLQNLIDDIYGND